MSGAWLSAISLVMVLVLAVGSLRAQRLGMSRMLVMALAWAAIILLAAGIATWWTERQSDPGTPPAADAAPALT